MTKRHRVLTDTDAVTMCGGCRFAPVRESWMRQCVQCGELRCSHCLPEGRRVCTGCRG